jgi:hypothetical protein
MNAAEPLQITDAASQNPRMKPGRYQRIRCICFVSVYMLTEPMRDKMSDLGRALLTRTNDMATPRRLGCGAPNPTIPTHFRPAILNNNLRSMPVVNYMVAHPICECNMVVDEVRIVAPVPKTSGLCCF